MKKKSIITILILFPFFFSNCKGGEVILNDSIIKIPFEYRLGLPIIKESINGMSYDFLFDTDATNLISNKLASEIGLKNPFGKIIGDSQGAKSNLKSVKKI